MRNHAGYYRTHRKWTDNPLLIGNANRTALWHTLLAWAKWSDNGDEVYFGGKMRKVLVGQIITSRQELATQIGISQTSVENILDLFQHYSMCDTQKTSVGRCITIVNYSKYQRDGQPNDNQVTTKCQPSDNQVTHTKKVKESKESKESKECCSEPEQNTSSKMVEGVVKVSKELNFVEQRVLELTSGVVLNDPKSIQDYYYRLLKEIGIRLPELSNASMEIESATKIFNGIVDKDKLVKCIWDFVYQTCCRSNCKTQFTLKKDEFKEYELWMSKLLNYLAFNKVVIAKSDNKQKTEWR